MITHASSMHAPGAGGHPKAQEKSGHPKARESWLAPTLFAAADAAPWPFAGLEPQAYSIIMADPPWHFALHSARGEAKSAQAQYRTMPIDEIAALPVSDLAREDCLLWLWATAPMLDQQMAVLAAWGFAFVSAGAWDKRRWGTGYVWRSVAEFILLGKRGEPRVDGRSVPNLVAGGAGRHSRKPDAAYAMAERMIPDPVRGPRVRRASLFERPVRPGWEGWGDEYGREPSLLHAPGAEGRHLKAQGKSRVDEDEMQLFEEA